MSGFHDLHHGALPLLLPNAWDVSSALAFVDAGFAAVGTTSFGLAAALGRPDGDRATRTATIDLARALVGALGEVPVSVDVEDGYDDDPAVVADLVAGLGVAGLGVAGVNLEDSSRDTLVDPGRHAAKVAAVKERSPGLFVNARVDTYWLGQQADVATTLARAERYVEAGADGIFVPGATEADDLRALAGALPVPLNVLVVPGRTLAELGALGVRRVSTGSMPYRAALDAAVGVATDVRDGRTARDVTPYARFQERLVDLERRSGGEPVSG